MSEEVDELKARLAEVTAERDELLRKLTEMRETGSPLEMVINIDASQVPKFVERVIAESRRAPVQPIPISEPPGDNDVVLLAHSYGRPALEDWRFDDEVCTWKRCGEHCRSAAFPDPTHYILLRKGEE